MLRPAIKHHWGLSPKKVQWIWKQMILPRLTYGCHVWDHSLTKTQILSIKKVARLALVYYAPMWKSTPTAGLEIILNQNPPHIEIQGVAIKSYICIKDVIKNTWDGNAFNKRLASHLQTLKNVAKTISHEGSAIELFECDHLREPFYNWNPPTHDIIMIACDNDVDDSFELPDHDSNDTNAIAGTDGENPQVDNENQYENKDIINAVVTHGDQTRLLPQWDVLTT